MKNRITILALFLFSSSYSVYSQNFYGLHNSNFSGINAVYFNPAGLADSRWRIHGNAICFSNSFQNSYVSLELPMSVPSLIKGNYPDSLKTPSGQLKWNDAWLKENLDGKPKNAYMLLELRGPGIMKSIGKGMAVAVATRVRFGLNFSNISEGILRFAKTANINNPPNLGYISDNSFAINSSLYQELSGSFAKVLINRDAYYIKGGFTAKYLQGLGAAYAINDGIKFHQQNDTVAIDQVGINVGYSSPDFINKLSSGFLGAVLPSFKDINGKGLGFDFGGIMEWRPKVADALTGSNRYLMKMGLSVMDIGAINYKSNVINYSASTSTTKYVTPAVQDSLGNAFQIGIDSGFRYLELYGQRNFNYKKGPEQFKVNIPSVINFQFDYNLIKWFYVGVNWTQSLLSPTKVAFRRPSSIVIIPRFEHRIIEASIPISVYNDYKNFGAGFYLRVGPAYIGSDNIFKTLNRVSFNGYDFYFGISTGIPKAKAKKKRSE